MEYRFDWIPQENIEEIKNKWKTLEVGSDMTYFQCYSWYEMLISFTPTNSIAVDCGYALVSDACGRPLVIAPLWIIKFNFLFVNKKGVYFIGRKGCTDYLNFIYDKFDDKAIDFLLSEISKKYKLNRFVFEDVLETTEFSKYLVEKRQIKPFTSEPCGCLNLGDSYENYLQSLSKNTRQNIRTAYNRLTKDNVTYKVVLNDVNADLCRCDEVRNARLAKKKSYNASLLIKLKTAIYGFLDIKFPECIQHNADPNKHILSVYCDNKICMFFCYGIDKINKTVVLMTAGVDEAYKRYSLGMVGLTEFIHHLIDNTEIKKLDFLRGGEFYKYAIGAQDRNIYSFEFLL